MGTCDLKSDKMDRSHRGLIVGLLIGMISFIILESLFDYYVLHHRATLIQSFLSPTNVGIILATIVTILIVRLLSRS